MKYDGIVCPHCGQALSEKDNMLKCAAGHSFDIAAAGYVNLLPPHKKVPGDNKEMVQARRFFLDRGGYSPLAERLAALIQGFRPAVLADVGCGEGYYTGRIRQQLSHCRVYGFDISKFALAAAAKRDREIAYCVANLHRLPLSDCFADAVLCCFCPIDEGEFARVLKPGGRLVLVSPGQMHLMELKRILYEAPYENEEEARCLEGFDRREEQRLTYTFSVEQAAELQALFAMTPYYWKTPPEGAARLAAYESLAVTADFRIELFEKK